MLRKIILVIIFSLCFWRIMAQEVHIAKYKGDKLCAISYTFDDGLADQYAVAYPELEKRGFKATFFVTPSKIESKGRCTWAQLKEMAAHGHEISNHGWAHKNITTLALDEVKQEIDKGDSAIVANVGKYPVTYAYPGNRKGGEGMDYVAQNRVGTRMFQISWGMKNKDNFHKYLMQTVRNGEWLVTMTHGLESGYDALHDSLPFLQHLDEVKAMEDKIWVATFAEVAAYIAEREATKIEVKKTKKGFKITPSCTLDPELFHEQLTLIIKTEKGETRLIDFNPHGGSFTIQ